METITVRYACGHTCQTSGELTDALGADVCPECVRIQEEASAAAPAMPLTRAQRITEIVRLANSIKGIRATLRRTAGELYIDFKEKRGFLARLFGAEPSAEFSKPVATVADDVVVELLSEVKEWGSLANRWRRKFGGSALRFLFSGPLYRSRVYDEATGAFVMGTCNDKKKASGAGAMAAVVATILAIALA